MTGRPMSDAVLAAALRAHLPAHAQPGLRDRITVQVAQTRQSRRGLWLLGLVDADPMVQRRAVLLVALLALAAAVSIAAVGAWLKSQNEVVERVPSITPGPLLARGPSEADTFVAGAYEQFWNLPAFQLVLNETMSDGTSQAYRHYWDGRVLRTHSGGWQVMEGPDFSASLQQLEGRTVWVVAKHQPSNPFGGYIAPARPNCITGWEHVEFVDVIGRRARHVQCTTNPAERQEEERDFWIDVATGLPLRMTSTIYRSGTSAPKSFVEYQVEVTELTFGPQDPALFVPSDETISAEAFNCATEGECASPGPSATPRSLRPVVTPPPAPKSADPPGDLTTYVAEVLAGYESGAPVDIVIEPAPALPTGMREWRRDGLGSFRSSSWLVTGGHFYEAWPRGDALWRRWGDVTHPPLPAFDLPAGCGLGWSYLGDDLVLGRPAAHLACGFQEFWIDREWLLVTRAHDRDPEFGDDPGAGLSEVVSVTFGPQPAELFARPAPDKVWRSP